MTIRTWIALWDLLLPLYGPLLIFSCTYGALAWIIRQVMAPKKKKQSSKEVG
jgi:hypothetical protein